MSRFRSLVVSSSVVAACVVGLAGGVTAASGASTLPTLNIALNGTTGVSVSGSEVSGAVNVVSTFTGTAPSGPNANGPTWGLVRLNPGATVAKPSLRSRAPTATSTRSLRTDRCSPTPRAGDHANRSDARQLGGPEHHRERKPGTRRVHRHPVLIASRTAERGGD